MQLDKEYCIKCVYVAVQMGRQPKRNYMINEDKNEENKEEKFTKK